MQKLNYFITSFLAPIGPGVTASIDVSGVTVIGDSVTLTCNVTGLDSLASDTTIEFSGPRAAMGTGTSLQLTLNHS